MYKNSALILYLSPDDVHKLQNLSGFFNKLFTASKLESFIEFPYFKIL